MPRMPPASRRLAAEAAIKGLPDLAALQGTQSAHESLSRCVANLATARQAGASATHDEEKAKRALAAAEATLETASADLKALEVAHRAEDLAHRLVVGEPCPVCQQVVKTKPAHHAPRALTKAQRAEKEATKAVGTARTALAQAAGTFGEAKGTIATLEKERQGLETQIKTHPDLEKLKASIAETKGKLDALEDARQERRRSSCCRPRKAGGARATGGGEHGSAVGLRRPA